jgi:hypothetical protein
MTKEPMMLRHVFARCLLGTVAAAGVDADADIRVRVTQRYLVARCFNGNAVDPGTRKWDVAPGPVTLAFSMRSEPRGGGPAPDSGTATISFTAETGHRYEVEVRADPATFSSRVWRAGEWIPVVRDRTTDRIVSDAARWTEEDCAAR